MLKQNIWKRIGWNNYKTTSPKRKFKYAIAQLNFFGINNLFASTENLIKKITGVWVRKKATAISVDFTGTIYFEQPECGTDCVVPKTISSNQIVKVNKSSTYRKVPYTNAFWTRANTVTSTHWVYYSGNNYTSHHLISKTCK